MGDEPTGAEVHALFERVLELDDAARAAVLDEACAGRPALRRRVEALLEIDASEHTLLDDDPSRFWALLVEGAAPEHQEIGPYRIVRELGRGGMGVVYLAERTDPELRQRVALKVVGPRSDAHHLAERFRRERQILANLRHPNIAQLYDGGATPDGLPYLAMEYVEGRRIDEWCDERRLTVDARLHLFLTVCAAVQHAQQNLVVHRDLKPANILVTDDGVVKLLDFGIAKLLPGSGDDAPDLTRTALHALTPRYASPEQIRGGAIGTAADVYALGVVLHELLSGAGPFATTTNPFEAARAVLEHEPLPPSQAVPASGRRTPAERAAARGTTPERLRSRLRGELDAIVRKALRKDPAARYPTAAALGEDIARYLRHEPVTARPDSAGYRLRKLVRRRRGAVAAAIAIVALSSGFTAVHTVRITDERNRARLEAEKAQEARDFLLGLFTISLPHQNLGEELTLGDILERGVARTDSITDRPELRALLLTTLGDVYRVLGRYDRAEPLIRTSIAEYRALGTDELGLADALTSLSNYHYDRREYEDAIPPMREALAIQQRFLDDDDARVITSMHNLATLASRTGDLGEALRAQEDVLAREIRVRGADHPSVGVTLNNIGVIHYREGRLDEAERYMREVLELRRRILPREHPDMALSLNNLASVLEDAGDLDGAESLYREALELRVQVLGTDHPSVAVSHYNLGRLFHDRGDLEAAESHLRTAFEMDLAIFGPDHPEVGVDAFQLAVILIDGGDCRAAAPLLGEAARIFAGAGRDEQLERVRAQQAACGSEG